MSIKGRMQKSRTIVKAISENETFFGNLAISICSNIVVGDRRKNLLKPQFLTIFENLILYTY